MNRIEAQTTVNFLMEHIKQVKPTILPTGDSEYTVHVDHKIKTIDELKRLYNAKYIDGKYAVTPVMK